MYQPLTANRIRIYNISSTTTAKTLRELLNAALAGKSGDAATLPNDGRGIVQIALTPSANIVLSDALTGDGSTIASGTRTVIPVMDALDFLKVLNTATVTLELFFDNSASNAR